VIGAGPAPLPAEWASANVVRVVLDAYCLELARSVPTEGMVFRIADRAAQEANAPVRAILASSCALRDVEALRPASDPSAYFHSIRQWAIWVDENRLDKAGFEDALVEHARRNFVAAGRTWSEEVAAQVRGLVPNRWNDVAAILEGAGRPLEY
jgi:hypothetical protein